MAELVFPDTLCWLLVRAGHVLTTEIAAGLAELGFGPRDHEVLAAARTGEHSQIELARMVGMDKTTMVVTLDALEAKGLAARRPSQVGRAPASSSSPPRDGARRPRATRSSTASTRTCWRSCRPTSAAA
jgi:hypothetical protein